MKIKNYTMKKIIQLALVAGLSVMLFSCHKKSDDSSSSTPNVGTTDVFGPITGNVTWKATDKILLHSYVYVENGAKLTIEPGCVIRGDKDSKGALIIEPGAQLFAQGTPSNPIVFTSNQPAGGRNYGDWGGVILCGRASVNNYQGTTAPVVEGGPRTQYGSNNDDTYNGESSGALSYVRIEFAGIAFSPNNEINGLTFCGVGSGTSIDHIQVSYSGDDSYEWFGGIVNTKYLIAHRGWDDDFDTDCGYSGMNQFLVGIRDPYAADQSGSKAFESDTDANNGSQLPITKCAFSNATCLIATPTNNISPQFVAAAHIRRNSQLSLYNSVLMGYPCGILNDVAAAHPNVFYAAFGTVDSMRVRNTIIAGIPTGPITGSDQKNVVLVVQGTGSLTPTTTMADTTAGAYNPFAGPKTWLMTKAFKNAIYATSDNVRLTNPYNLTNPSVVPTTTSPIVYNSKALPSYIPAGTFPGNVYPFDPSKAINTDTTNKFVNYNAPANIPNFAGPRIGNSFFTPTNYIGAFAGNQATAVADNWFSTWTNFDANNADYGSAY